MTAAIDRTNLNDWIDQRAFAIRWELSSMVWKAAEECGCLNEYIVQSHLAIMRREITRIFERASWFARRMRY